MFTSKYRVTRLVYFEEFSDIRDAIAREKEIKVWKRSRKVSLIETRNATWEDEGPASSIVNATIGPPRMSTIAGAALTLLWRKTMRALIVVIWLLVYPAIATSQQSTGASRARQIAAAFTKHKAVVAVKRGVTREKYKDVRAEPRVAQNVREYAGRYVSDLGWWIEILVGADGQTRGTGDEAGQPCDTFELKSATIEGALLTATKVCRNGTVERLEGVFMNRTDRVSPTDAGTTMFGLGVMLAQPREVAGNTFERLFYPLDR